MKSDLTSASENLIFFIRFSSELPPKLHWLHGIITQMQIHTAPTADCSIGIHNNTLWGIY